MIQDNQGISFLTVSAQTTHLPGSHWKLITDASPDGWGALLIPVVSRKTPVGNVPQSKHHVKSRQNLRFAVRMSLIQVTQERTEQPKHGDDSLLQDLLISTLSKKASSPMRSSSPIASMKSVKTLVATLERARATAVSSVSSSVSSQSSEAQITGINTRGG